MEEEIKDTSDLNNEESPETTVRLLRRGVLISRTFPSNNPNSRVFREYNMEPIIRFSEGNTGGPQCTVVTTIKQKVEKIRSGDENGTESLSSILSNDSVLFKQLDYIRFNGLSFTQRIDSRIQFSDQTSTHSQFTYQPIDILSETNYREEHQSFTQDQHDRNPLERN